MSRVTHKRKVRNIGACVTTSAPHVHMGRGVSNTSGTLGWMCTHTWWEESGMLGHVCICFSVSEFYILVPPLLLLLHSVLPVDLVRATPGMNERVVPIMNDWHKPLWVPQHAASNCYHECLWWIPFIDYAYHNTLREISHDAMMIFITITTRSE